MTARVGRRAMLLAPLGLAARAARAADPLPIIFVHGNGDTAGLWLTILWRFESNAYPANRLFALDLRYPQASAVWDKPQPGRTTAAEAMAQLAAEVMRVQALTGASEIVLVGQSRGGNTIRNYLKNGGGAAHVPLAVLCGAVNHGVIVSDKYLVGSEFNGASPFMHDLNSTPDEVLPGVHFVTIRSDEADKYAQPDGAALGLPGTPTGVGYSGPALAGAENLVIHDLDHRETGFSASAFRVLHRVITLADPHTMAIVPEAHPVLNGKISGFEAGTPTNIGIPGARLTVFHVDPATADRQGEPVHTSITGADGLWGPFTADPTACHEFVIEAATYPATHIYRGPLPRSTTILHMRPQPFGKDDHVPAVLYMTRPRGYYGLGRDKVQLNHRAVSDIPPGVPTVSSTRFVGAPGQQVIGTFNSETIAARTWAASENHVSVIEITT